MADEEESQPPQEDAAKKGKLAEEWRKLATWQKAGVVIGGLGLVAGAIYFMNRQSTPTSTGNDTLTGTPNGAVTGAYGPNGAPTGYPGEGDQYPPVPVQPTGGPTTPTPTPVQPPTPTPTPAGNPIPQGNPRGKPNGVFASNPFTAAPRQQITPMPTRAFSLPGGVKGGRLGTSRAAAPKGQPIRQASGISAAQWNAMKGRI